MTLAFSLESVQSVEFGIGHDSDDPETFSLIPVDEDVQSALKEMAADTWAAMLEKGDPIEYQPSEKYASQEYLYLSADDGLATRLRDLHRAHNLPLNASALEEPKAIFCYFAKLIDSRRQRLTAVRRANQFKGILKSRLIQFVTDALKLVEDDTFKLDSDFDVLIDSAAIHILRPSGFEFTAKVQTAIRESVKGNVASIQKDMPFVDFSNIELYAASHTRAARYLSSIRSQREAHNISQALLRKACRAHGVDLRMKMGQ